MSDHKSGTLWPICLKSGSSEEPIGMIYIYNNCLIIKYPKWFPKQPFSWLMSLIHQNYQNIQNQVCQYYFLDTCCNKLHWTVSQNALFAQWYLAHAHWLRTISRLEVYHSCTNRHTPTRTNLRLSCTGSHEQNTIFTNKENTIFFSKSVNLIRKLH